MPHYLMPDGEKLYVREFGQGTPVLVLSGLGMQSWQWLPFLYQHRKKYRFYIPDWRGFGGSAQCKIPTLDAISSHWQDLNCFLNQYADTAFHVIAYSMGATTAMHGMQYGRFQDHIRSYLHIDQTPKISVDADWPHGLFAEKHANFKAILQNIADLLAQNAQYRLVSDLTASMRTELVKQWLAFIQLQATPSRTAALFQKAFQQPYLQKFMLPIQRLDYMAWYIQNYLDHQEDYRGALSQIDRPATFFIGEESKLYAAQGQKLIASSVPHAKTVIFKKSGHTPLLSEPHKFSQEITRFLNATNI
ncbi:alpha/beta hydrolase [Acinetobacter sp. MF4642]|uniref:alpha/beta fold hydrolase n=1 Tax=Acinetobacter sp. MF4642 TaxID=1960825 RepID=UPI000994A14F|nr:alpha/beta hydrolase [Acinetobacter sp. MF4642]OOW12348.1 alpha/beta hydrolase [Acinetobacter sp. MF4642]